MLLDDPDMAVISQLHPPMASDRVKTLAAAALRHVPAYKKATEKQLQAGSASTSSSSAAAAAEDPLAGIVYTTKVQGLRPVGQCGAWSMERTASHPPLNSRRTSPRSVPSPKHPTPAGELLPRLPPRRALLGRPAVGRRFRALLQRVIQRQAHPLGEVRRRGGRGGTQV